MKLPQKIAFQNVIGKIVLARRPVLAAVSKTSK